MQPNLKAQTFLKTIYNVLFPSIYQPVCKITSKLDYEISFKNDFTETKANLLIFLCT